MARPYQIVLAALGATILSLILAFAFLEIHRYVQWVRDKVRQGYTYEAKWLWFWIKLEPTEFTRRRAAAAPSPSETDDRISVADMEMGRVEKGLITDEEIVCYRRLW